MTVTLPGPARRDAALPGLERLTDRAAVATLLGQLPWLRAPEPWRAAVRLRWKPGTNARLGVVVPTADGPCAVLVAVFGARSRGKAGALGARAERFGLPVYRDDQLVAVPAGADPDLGRLVPFATPIAYNPARRWVGRDRGQAIKVHAVAPPIGVTALLTAPPGRLARHLPATQAHHAGRVVLADWVRGAPPARDDLPAVRVALAALHGTRPGPGLPVLDRAAVLQATDVASRSVATALPGERDRLRGLSSVLQRACAAGRWPDPAHLVHGDFSPDQVVVHAGHAVLLDLDRAARGPVEWDAAQWVVAQDAVGVRSALPPPAPVPPLLLLAAALLRAPEPFRTLRADWPGCTRRILTRASAAAREVAR
jgi:aminoglycoside phosphotransferase (APT) family kinase protein